MEHPALGKPMKGGEISPLMLFRESMKKFDGKILDLGVIRCSTFSQAYLNRQVILILDFLGVPRQVFLDKNRRAIEGLNVDKIIERLSKQAREIRKLNQGKREEEGQEKIKDLISQLKVYFGPSRQFSKIFKNLILNSSAYTKLEKD